MTPITANLLILATGCTPESAAVYSDPLGEACLLFEIDTDVRLAPFLAQIGHESASFSRVVENLNYTAAGLLKTWPSRFSAESALLFARQPERIANHVYGKRMGNKAPGDGWLYRGRGLIQITGKIGYEVTTEALLEKLDAVPDFTINPEQLAAPIWAALSAGSYWQETGLNELADAGQFDKITRRINGGQNGRDDRIARFRRAREALE